MQTISFNHSLLRKTGHPLLQTLAILSLFLCPVSAQSYSIPLAAYEPDPLSAAPVLEVIVHPHPSAALDPAWMPLINRLVFDGFDRTIMENLFASLGQESYTPAFMAAKITELYGVPGIGVNREKSTAPQIPEGYIPPVPDVTVGSCLAFMKEHESILAAIEKKHGVQAQTILAVLLIETSLGRDLGKDPALRALGSMAATSTPEMLERQGNAGQRTRVRPAALASTLREKSNWAYKELKALLRYAERLQTDPAAIPGSIYGAIGLCQFMPSNVELFAVDGDNDGRIDLFCLPDAMYSVASYLEANGWRGGSSDDHRLRVIRTYNNDGMYAAAVLATSKRLENARLGKGKISLASSAVVGGGGGGRRNPTARLNPSLRWVKNIPKSARIQSLGNYQQLLE